MSLLANTFTPSSMQADNDPEGQLFYIMQCSENQKTLAKAQKKPDPIFNYQGVKGDVVATMFHLEP